QVFTVSSLPAARFRSLVNRLQYPDEAVAVAIALLRADFCYTANQEKSSSYRKPFMSILKKLNDVSVGKKLATGFVLVVILTIAVSAIGINTLSAFNERAGIVATASSVESKLLNARVEVNNFI